MPKEYFLGASTGGGFYSLYDSFVKDGDFLYILKGGPGCGKSTFMRRIGEAAEAAGHTVEYVLCSGDPSSLDGVYITDLGVAFADGTAPHVLESDFPAVQSNYVNLGVFYDQEALASFRREIEVLTQACRDKYDEAYEALGEAKVLHDLLEAVYNPHVDFEGVNRLAAQYIGKILRQKKP